jgi:hypothetical protein
VKVRSYDASIKIGPDRLYLPSSSLASDWKVPLALSFSYPYINLLLLVLEVRTASQPGRALYIF